jgi:hypothetical protein
MFVVVVVVVVVGLFRADESRAGVQRRRHAVLHGARGARGSVFVSIFPFFFVSSDEWLDGRLYFGYRLSAVVGIRTLSTTGASAVSSTRSLFII